MISAAAQTPYAIYQDALAFAVDGLQPGAQNPFQTERKGILRCLFSPFVKPLQIRRKTGFTQRLPFWKSLYQPYAAI